MADIEKELAELRESQERGKISMEHSVAEASIYLQDQVRLPRFAERGPAVLRGGSPAPTHQSLLRPPPMRAFQEVTVQGSASPDPELAPRAHAHVHPP